MTTDIMPNDSVAARRPLLLVDDDQPFRDRLMTTLDRSGFVVIGVGSLAEAR